MPKLTYPGQLRPSGKGWEWRVSVGGKRRSTTFHGTKGQAAEQANTRYAELGEAAERQRIGLPDLATVSALFDRFEHEALPGYAKSSRRAYRSSLKHLRRYFAGKRAALRVDQIRPGHITAFLTWRAGHDIKRRTLANERTRLRVIFSYAEGIELRTGNPVTKVTKVDYDEREAVLISAAEYERLLVACAHDPMLETYVLLLGETGMRCDSEVLRLRWIDLDLDTGPGWIHVPALVEAQRTKTGKGRRVPMTARLRAALREHAMRFRGALYGNRTSPWVFHHRHDKAPRQAGDQIGRIKRAFSTAADAAELPAAFVQHDLRHRRITTWLAAGKPLAHVMAAVGHENLATTQGYMHLVHQDLESLVAEDLALLAVEGGDR